MTPSDELREKYRASMVLSAAGDALGYKNQEWEYCKSGPQIHRELEALGGLSNITVCLPGWPISDDTVMHLATAEAIVEGKSNQVTLFRRLAEKYVESMDDMEGRKPGPTSIQGCKDLKPSEEGGFRVPFNPNASGCGAAMRSMCVGLRFPEVTDLRSLVVVSLESGRMTHHHPTGYLGAVAAAYFTACALNQVPLPIWGRRLVEEVLPIAKSYVEESGVSVEDNLAGFSYFEEKWKGYLKERGIHLADDNTKPTFPAEYDVERRDVIYASWSFDGWAGRSGHDAPMIAYDALLAAGSDWEELCRRSMFHAGDSDSTGVIAASCFGALYGFQGVPTSNYEQLEYRDRIEKLSREIYDLKWSHS